LDAKLFCIMNLKQVVLHTRVKTRLPRALRGRFVNMLRAIKSERINTRQQPSYKGTKLRRLVVVIC